jgi:hypothetical protein
MTFYKSKRYRSRCNLGIIDNVLAQFPLAVYGYFGGGYDGNYKATIDRIVFSSGITSVNTVSNLSTSRYGLAGVSDCSTYGYFAGGYSSIGNSAITDRIQFSDEIVSANTVSNLSQARSKLAGLSDGSTYGYFGGGTTNAFGQYVATVDCIQFSDGTMSTNTSSNLTYARNYLSSASSGEIYGYFVGGYSGVITAMASKINFSTKMTSAHSPASLSVARYGIAGLSNGSTHGYFAGGISGDPPVSTMIDRLVFSTSTTSVNTVSVLSIGKWKLAAVSDGANYGYFSGGDTNSNAYSSSSDRIDFSDGIVAANTVSNLSSSREQLAGLSDYSV